MWAIAYRRSVQKDLRGISRDVQYIIRRSIEDKLAVDPLRFGLPLRGSLKGLMKLRVGDYRVIYSIEKNTVTIHVVKIGHRKQVYEE